MLSWLPGVAAATTPEEHFPADTSRSQPIRPAPGGRLRLVPEPPGGLVPYRHGKSWGYADTTGRVRITPSLPHASPFYGGLVITTVAGTGDRRTITPERYPSGITASDPCTTTLLNARGEQLVADADEVFALVVLGADSSLVVGPRATHLGAWELVGSGRHPVFTRVKAHPPLTPARLLRRRRFEQESLAEQWSRAPTPPVYAARKVNWLLPTRLVWVQGRCGDRGRVSSTNYRHRGRLALFSERGQRLTRYGYWRVEALIASLLRYAAGKTHDIDDFFAANQSGLPQPWKLEDLSHNARYGILSQRGRELTPPLFQAIKAVGPNAFWVVVAREHRLLYGVIDSVGNYLIPASPNPLSGADDAGLLRQRSAPPLVSESGWSSSEVAYPPTTTVRYVRPDGRPAFEGQFEQADAFWHGRARVRQYGRAGLIDTLGRWIVPPDRYTYLRYYGHTDPHRESDLRADPLLLFEGLDSDDSRGGWYAPLLDDSVLLVQRQGVYGLAGSRTGRELIAPCFDEPPAQLVGGVRGTRRGKPWLATLTGLSQPYDPSQPLPPGLSVYDSRAAELSNFFQTKEGYKTRHGRALWKD